ncbi:unnamed protein product [Somion occarium]|uniref:Nuclear distribution protein PAC1 n=2 Tax=Somion occarium TaxID=3059160 RepID=A0ABP1DQD0_9APHY
MSNVLSERQRDDLHRAMLDYLNTAGFLKTFEQFKAETAPLEYEPEDDQRMKGLLIKKWTSVIRLQKKIMDLESRLAQALQEMAQTSTMPLGYSKRNDPDWLPASGPPKHNLTSHRGKVNAVTFHPLYSVIVSASDDSTMKVWDWETGSLEQTIHGHTKRVSDCEFDSKGTQLVSASYDLFIKLWAVDNGYKNFATLRGHNHSISSVRFLPGDDRVVSASRDATIRIWDIATNHCIRTLSNHSDWVRCAIPNVDGQYLVTCCSDHTAQVIELSSGKTKTELRGHDNAVQAAVFVPRMSAPAIGELIMHKTGAAAPTLTVNAGLAYVVTASRDQKIKIWDAVHGTCLHTLVGHDGWVNGLAFHPNGRYMLSAADDGSIRIWELKTGRCVRKLETGEQFLSSLSWGRQTTETNATDTSTNTTATPKLINVIAAGCWDYTVKIWMP